jgi:hypothetical protein
MVLALTHLPSRLQTTAVGVALPAFLYFAAGVASFHVISTPRRAYLVAFFGSILGVYPAVWGLMLWSPVTICFPPDSWSDLWVIIGGAMVAGLVSVAGRFSTQRSRQLPVSTYSKPCA